MLQQRRTLSQWYTRCSACSFASDSGTMAMLVARFKKCQFWVCEGDAVMAHRVTSQPSQSEACRLLVSHFGLTLDCLEPRPSRYWKKGPGSRYSDLMKLYRTVPGLCAGGPSLSEGFPFSVCSRTKLCFLLFHVFTELGDVSVMFTV